MEGIRGRAGRRGRAGAAVVPAAESVQRWAKRAAAVGLLSLAV